MSSHSEITRALALIRDAVRTIKTQCPQNADLIVYQVTHVALYNPAALDTFLHSSLVPPEATDKQATPGPTETHPKTPPRPKSLPKQSRSGHHLSTADPFDVQGSQHKTQHNSSLPLKRKHGGSGEGVEGEEELLSLPRGSNFVEVTPGKRRALRNAKKH